MAHVLSRVAGSVAFVAAARSVLLLGADPEDREGPTRILAHAKSNLGPLAPALRLRIEGREVPGADGSAVPTSGIAWCGEAAGVTAADLVASAAPEEEGEAGEAMDFLRDLLAGGPVASAEVEKALRKARVQERAWRKAKRRLRVRSVKLGFDRGWAWALPEDEPEGVRPPKTSSFDADGASTAEKVAPNAEEGRPAEDGQTGEAAGGASIFAERASEELTVEDVLATFPGATVQACPTCGSTTWRRSGDGEQCVRCGDA